MSSPAVDYDALARQHGAVDYDALAQQHGANEQPAGRDDNPLREMLGPTAGDVATGAFKGALSTVFHAGDLLRRAETATAQHLPGPVKDWLDSAPQSVKDFVGYGARPLQSPDVQAAMTPTNTPQAVGKAGEQMAEYLIPGEAGGGALAKIGSAALGSGGVALAQTGDFGDAAKAAAIGAAGSSLLQGAAKAAPILSDAMKTSATKQYAQALGATTKGNKLRSAAVVPELIDRGVAGSLQGIQGRAADEISKWGEAINDAWANLPPGTSIELDPVLNSIQNKAAEHMVANSAGQAVPMGEVAGMALKHSNALQETLLDVAEKDPATGKLVIPADKLRQLRQYFDSVSAQAGRFNGADLATHSAAAAHAAAADAIRAELGKGLPDIDSLNKEYSFWKNVNQVVSDTILRREGQAKPLGQKLAAVAGAAAGAPHGLIGAKLGADTLGLLTKAVSSPAWKTGSAIVKDRLADAIASGNRGAIAFYANKLARLPASVEGNPTPQTGSTQ